uniref:Alkaline phosphatase core domain n=1 Tax=Echinococcus granulosus TaxID=6210 RepID=A0A068WWH2_ECHGR|nr:Alkaline phosphatase core domain [Echinococcus granulosus]
MVFSCDALIWPIFSVCYVIAMLSVFLSSFESFIVNDVHPLKFNSSPPLAKRVVFITIDGLGEHILRRTKHKYVKFLTWVFLYLLASPILPQNSVSVLMVSLLSTILPSNSQSIVPVHLLNTSAEVKASLIRDNIRHLVKLREALIRRANRHSILPLFFAHEEDLPDDLDALVEKEMALQRSLQIASWLAWFVDFIFWTLSVVLLSLALAINLTDLQSRVPLSKSCFYCRLGILGLASIELYRVFRWLLDYNEEPNYREMITLNFGCIVCEFFLGDYATAGRRLLAKLFKSTGPQRRHILRLPLAILQAFLIIKGFDEPRCFAATGALFTVDLAFDETVRRKGKYAVLLLIALALLLGLWIYILHSRGFQVLFVLLLALFWFIFNRQIGAVKTGQISFWEWALLELRVLLFNFLLLNTYMFGLNIYSTSTISSMLKIRAGWNHISGRIILINGPVLALFIAYVYSTWKRELQHGVSALRAQALVWILFTPLTFAQGTANLGYTDSWSQIVKHLAYFIYLTVRPLICAFTLKTLSHILHLSDA